MANTNLTYFLIIGILFLLVSGISLYFSYVQCSSPEWQRKFSGKVNSKKGLYIELIRSVIIIFSSMYLLGSVFLSYTLLFFHFFGKIPGRETHLYLDACRRGTFLLLIIGLPAIVYQHLHLGPKQLQENTKKNRIFQRLSEKDKYKKYKRPYLFYFPYSFINFIVLGIPTVSVSFYASLNNLQKVETAHNFLEKSIKSIKNCGTIINKFDNFSNTFIDSFGTKSALFLCLAILIIFELNFGNETLSKSGKWWTWIAFVVMGFALLSIAFGYHYYEEILQITATRLSDVNCSDLNKFRDERSVLQVSTRIVGTHSAFYIIILLLTPAFSRLKNILKITPTS